jgi:hypothetical protein
VKGDANLKDSLIEPVPHRTRLGAPQAFQRLVWLEILPATELGNAFEQQRWRRLGTPVQVTHR